MHTATTSSSLSLRLLIGLPSAVFGYIVDAIILERLMYPIPLLRSAPMKFPAADSDERQAV